MVPQPYKTSLNCLHIDFMVLSGWFYDYFHYIQMSISKSSERVFEIEDEKIEEYSVPFHTHRPSSSDCDVPVRTARQE